MSKRILAWCPVCNQGCIEIIKEIETEDLFCCCDECMCEWNHPIHISTQPAVACAKRDILDKACDPTDEEIAAQGWDKYIIHEYKGHPIG